MLPKDTLLGTLCYREIYIEYDGPQLFSAENEAGDVFLAMHAPLSEAGDNWLWRHVANLLLDALEANQIDLRSVLASEAADGLYIVTFGPLGTLVVAAASKQIEPRWFPKSGVFLHAEAEDAEANVKASPPTALDIPAVRRLSLTQRPILDLSSWVVAEVGEINFLEDEGDIVRRRATINSGGAIPLYRLPVEEVAQRTRRMVCDLTLGPNTDQHDVPVENLGRLLVTTQRMVDALGDGYQDTPRSRGSRSKARDWSQLNASALMPGSFIVRLETAIGSVVPDPRMAFAFDMLLDLVRAGDDSEALRVVLKRVGRKAAHHYRAFAQILSQNAKDVSLNLGVPNRTEAREEVIGSLQLATLTGLLAREITSVPEDFTFVGKLVGASLKSKVFMLEGADRTISGRIADEAIISMRQKQLDALHRAKIRTVMDFNESTGEEVQHHTLLHIEAAQ